MSERDLPTWAEGDLQNPAFMMQKLRQLTEAMQNLMGTRNQSGTGLAPGWYRNALGGGGGTTIIGGGGGGGVSTDPTPPPAPTGLMVSGGLANIGVVFDAPTYTQGGGNAYTVLYGAKWIPEAPAPNPKPTFANAVQLGSLPGRSSVMFVATEPNTYWCIWAVFVTTAGVSGPPGGGTNGAQGQTGQDPSVLLELLSGQITASELHESLSRPIALIGSTINQVDSSWWVQGASLPSGWTRNGTATENAFINGIDHTGKTSPLWRCTSEDPYSPEPDGGWEAALPALDRSKTYRFMLPVRKNAGATGYAYWGFYSAEGDSNPYFTVPPLSVLEAGQWYWLVGFVYPTTATPYDGPAGTYNASTGDRTHSGINFRWAASGAQIHRAYLYYAEAGAQIDFGRPLVHEVDGNEPPLDAIIRGTAGAVAAAQALVQTESTARQTGDTALAQSITTLSATVGSNAAAIQVVAEATADLEDHVAANYSVKAQVTAGGRTAVGGFALNGSVGESGPTITFGVVANQFWVGAPAGTPGVSADILPFIIQTAPTVINGVTIPAGVYMDAAYITNLTALVARLGTAWIDNAMIANLSAGKITSGSLQVGEYIQSTGYVPGVDGFRITGSGSAEFSSIIARGTIYASAGTIGGAVIDSTGVKSTNFVQGVSGWRLDNNLGKLFAMSGQIGGASIEGERLVTRYGSTMKVEGAPFGTSNQFVLWWGPILSDIALCSETNATIQYVKTNGDAYFGGSLAAGVLKNSARTSSTIATAEIEVGPFLTNGNSKTIVVSYGYSHSQQGNHGSMSLGGSGGATITLERSLNGGAWVTLQTFSTPPASGNLIVDDDPTAPDSVYWDMGSAITTTDTSAATTNMRLRARITARSLMSVGGTGLSAAQIIQSLSVVCTEQ